MMIGKKMIQCCLSVSYSALQEVIPDSICNAGTLCVLSMRNDFDEFTSYSVLPHMFQVCTRAAMDTQ